MGARTYWKMGSPSSLCPTTIRPSQRPSSRLRTMPSPDGLRLAIVFNSLPMVFLPVNFFPLPFVGTAALRPQFHGNPPGWAEAGNEATQCYFFLCHCVSIHQPEQFLFAFLVQQSGNLLALRFQLPALFTVWPGCEPSLQCSHVVVYGASLLCSDTTYHRLAETAMGNGESYQNRHIFLRCAAGPFFGNTGAIYPLPYRHTSILGLGYPQTVSVTP